MIADSVPRIPPEKVIDYLDNYGVVHCIQINSKSLLENYSSVYSIGIQPIFDYLLAIIVLDKSSDLNKIFIDKTNKYSNGTLQMLSIILIIKI